MSATFTVNVQGEIRLPDIALLAQAMLGQPTNLAPTHIPAPAPVPVAPAPAPLPPQPPVNPTPVPVAPAPQTPPAVPQLAIPAVPSVPAPSDPAIPGTKPPKYSIDEIARAGAELAQQGPDKIAALTGLLQQFGLQAVTQLRQDQMGPFVLALRGLGARI